MVVPVLQISVTLSKDQPATHYTGPSWNRRYQSTGHHFLFYLSLFSFFTSYCTFSSFPYSSFTFSLLSSSISSCFSVCTSPSHGPFCYHASTTFSSSSSIHGFYLALACLCAQAALLLSLVSAGFHSSAAVVDRRRGGRFQLLDGSISGEFTHLVRVTVRLALPTWR